MPLIGTIGRTHGYGIAVAYHPIGLLQIQFLTIQVEEREFLHLLRGRIDDHLTLQTTHIGETLLIIVVTGNEHLSQFLTCDLDFHEVVLEGIHLHHITHREVASGMILDAHTTGILIREIGICLCEIGLTDHTSQFFTILERCLSNGQDTLEGGILGEIAHQFGNGLVLTRHTLHGDKFCFLLHDLSTCQHQCGVCGERNTLRILGDQDAIVHLTALNLGMRMSAYNDIHPRQLCREFNIGGIT